MTVTITRVGNNTIYAINYNRQGSGGTTTPASTSATHTHATPGMGAGAPSAFALPFTKAGASAAQYYANIAVDPTASTLARVGATICGAFASLWTPDTAVQTALTLAGGGVANGLLKFGRASVQRFVNQRLSEPVKKISKNSNDYVGDTHVYNIRGSNGYFKIGESAQGTRVRDGLSIRAEKQVRQLTRETDQIFRSKILKNFPNKRLARNYEKRLIQRFRRRFGQNTLPGNKGYR